jgi:guanylate kinase
VSEAPQPRKTAEGHLFVVSAPSGAGKTTLCRELLARRPDLRFAVSYATRKPRAGEVDGVDYVFVDEEEFQRMVEAGDFAEWARVHGNLYGTPRRALEEMLRAGYDVIHDIDVQGARQMRDFYGEAVYVFVLPPSMEALAERLSGRGTDPESVVRERLRRAIEEVREYALYDYVIVNDVLEKAVGELESVILARRLRVEDLDPAWVEENFFRQEE